MTSETAIAEKSKYYFFLEQEHRQQSQAIEQLRAKINHLENKLIENQAEKDHNQQEFDSSKLITQIQHLQEELSTQEHQLNDLKDLAEKTKDYYMIQQEHRQQSQTIEELKAKITQLENQPLTEPNNFKGDSSVVLAQIKSLHQELSIKEDIIAQLKSQIVASEGKIEEKAKNYLLLEQENRQKTQIIEQLRAKISNLETVAVIGERQLNKWRSRTFFS